MQSPRPQGYESQYDRKTRELFERAKRDNVNINDFKNNPNFKAFDQIKVEEESLFKKNLELAYKNEEDVKKKGKGKNKKVKDEEDEVDQTVLKFAKNKEVSTSFVGDDILSGDDFSVYLLSGKKFIFQKKVWFDLINPPEKKLKGVIYAEFWRLPTCCLWKRDKEYLVVKGSKLFRKIGNKSFPVK
ncbi:MAG: hypothetical protein CME61_01775 [Halobacteriovoraceae bacterium]|nr:hypothetical protein [Halobacteriovoraceae bacterium]